jgi:hypothetical protein
MLLFTRDDWTVEVDPTTWCEITEFFSANGWEPNVPTHRLMKNPFVTVDKDSAVALAAAGRIVLEEALC